MPPIQRVFDTGVSPIQINEDFLETSGLNAMQAASRLSLQSATNQKVGTVETFSLHVKT